MQFLTRKELLAKVKLCYATVWKLMKHKEFPLSRDTPGGPRWLEHEIDEWMAQQAKRDLSEHDPGIRRKSKDE